MTIAMGSVWYHVMVQNKNRLWLKSVFEIKYY